MSFLIESILSFLTDSALSVLSTLSVSSSLNVSSYFLDYIYPLGLGLVVFPTNLFNCKVKLGFSTFGFSFFNEDSSFTFSIEDSGFSFFRVDSYPLKVSWVSTGFFDDIWPLPSLSFLIVFPGSFGRVASLSGVFPNGSLLAPLLVTYLFFSVDLFFSWDLFLDFSFSA